jgi:peptidoglycan/xylan/chitin deacetylase (PgdA/CDA1 family)
MRTRLVLPILAFSLAGGLMFQPDWLARTVSKRVTYSVDTAEPAVALTIDDGPDPQTTPALLDILRAHQSRATFFLITDRISGNEALLQRMIAEGHELGNHMTREQPSILLGKDGFARELLVADSTLSPFGEVRWLRPGSGWFSSGMLETAESQGYRLALASIYPFDATIPSTWFASEFILWRAKPGAIILLHDYGDRGERTAETLERVLPELASRGYRVVTLSELVGLEG